MRYLILISPILSSSLVPLISGRPQYTSLQTEDWTQSPAINPKASPNALLIPPPNFQLPSAKDSPPPFDLSFLKGTPSANAETISQTRAPVGFIGVINDDIESGVPSGDDVFNLASGAQSQTNPAVLKGLNIMTEEAQINLDSLFSGFFTYSIFGLSENPNQIMTLLTSTTADWTSFGQDVRESKPSFALHPIPGDRVLLIFTYQNAGLAGTLSQYQAATLNSYLSSFKDFVGEKYQKGVQDCIVSDDDSLQMVIGRFSRAERVNFQS